MRTRAWVVTIGVIAGLSFGSDVRAQRDFVRTENSDLRTQRDDRASGPVLKRTLEDAPVTMRSGKTKLPVEAIYHAMCGSDVQNFDADDLARAMAKHFELLDDPARVQIINTSGPSSARGGAPGFDLIFITSDVPAEAVPAIQAIELYFEGLFTDVATVRINLTFQPLGAGILGSTGSTHFEVSYVEARDALMAGMDGTDEIQAWLPVGNVLPVRYNGNSSTVTGEDRVFVTVGNFNAVVGASNIVAADMTFSTNFAWDYIPPAIGPGQFGFMSVIAHEIGHALGFVSGADFRNNDLQMLDLWRFQFTDGFDDLNPDSFAEFQTTPRTVSRNAPVPPEDNAVSDVIVAEYRMADGVPNQASHFQAMNPGIFIMDPSLSSQETFFPDFFRVGDLVMFDAIGWDYPPEMPLEILVGFPPAIAPVGEPIEIDVTVNPNSDTLIEKSPAIFYRFDAGAFVEEALVLVIGDSYRATLPAAFCGDTVEYYVSAESTESGEIFFPDNAPSSTLSIAIGELVDDELVCLNPCLADQNDDRVVNAVDLAVLLGAWGFTDINGDGVTNGLDLALLLGAWGACP